MPEQTTTIGHTGEGEYRRLPVGEGGDVGCYDGGRGEAILLVHAGVFSDWFRLLSLELPRDRFRVVRVRRSGYRDTTPPPVRRSNSGKCSRSRGISPGPRPPTSRPSAAGILA